MNESRSFGIIVFARMSSSRLPGKMMLPFGAESLLARIVRRAATLGETVLIATSTARDDDAIAREADSIGAPVHRGALDDVLSRAVFAADEFGLEAIARLCGDRPFFPLDDMRRGLDCMRSAEAGMPDLITTHAPVPCPPGLTTEIVSTEALRRARRLIDNAGQREHMTRVLYERPDEFERVELTTSMHTLADHRFAVDTDIDYRLLSAVVEQRPDIRLSPYEAATIMVDLESGQSA